MGPVRLVCPRCRSELVEGETSLRCAGCAAVYPVVAGIPDLRVAPDPWIGLDADREKALRLDEACEGADLEEAVRTYWRLTPSTPPEQAERFIRHVLRARERSREWLDRTVDEGAVVGPWLDVGCGTADLAAAAGGSTPVVGIDVALRWLVVARLRLEREGIPAYLVCANAERLPFQEGAFQRVVSLGLLEHCADRPAVFREVRRVLRDGGQLRFRTANRFSVLPEPHVGVRGVGLLPKRWADPYVRWRTGHRYLHHSPAGPRELGRDLRKAGFSEARVEAAVLLPAELEALGPGARRLGPVYERVRSTPVARLALRWIAPLLEGRGVAA